MNRKGYALSFFVAGLVGVAIYATLARPDESGRWESLSSCEVGEGLTICSLHPGEPPFYRTFCHADGREVQIPATRSLSGVVGNESGWAPCLKLHAF